MAANPYELPNISTGADYSSIMNMLKSIQGLPTLQSTMVPAAEQVLGQQSQYLIPQVNAIREATGQNVAAQQSDAMKRGITGSSIEGQNMALARSQGTQNEAQLRSNFALQASQSLMGVLQQAIMGDQNAAMQLRVMLAQAMGDELGAQRDINMFREQMSQAEAASARAGKTALWGAGIGAIGSMLGGGAQGYMGRPR